MPRYYHKTSDVQKHHSYDLKRTPPAEPLLGIVVSHEITVVETHFWGGRTLPCEREQVLDDGTVVQSGCRACNAAVPLREHVYIAAVDPKTNVPFIFECTGHSSKTFEEHQKVHGVLRGCCFIAERPKKYKRAQVVIQTKQADLGRRRLPEPPDIPAFLSTVWQLPIYGLTMDKGPQPSKKAIVQKEALEQMTGESNNAPARVPFAAAVAEATGRIPPKVAG